MKKDKKSKYMKEITNNLWMISLENVLHVHTYVCSNKLTVIIYKK